MTSISAPLRIATAVLVSVNGASALAQTAPRQSHPNVIMVFIDDMGWSDLSCFGGQDRETECIDRLCTEGIRFTNFYVNSPICSPSRTALTTGQYPQRWKITSYLARRELNVQRGMAQWLDPVAPTLARQLQQTGYATGHFGKWHMGGQRDVGEAPLISAYGFDASLTNFEGLGPRVLPLCDAYDGKPPRKHALGSDTLGHGPITWEDRNQVTAAFVKRTLEFIQDAEKAKQPFYVNVWPDDVHSPFFPPATRRVAGSKRENYLGVLDTMDEQLGVLFDYVRSQPALARNTLIVLASDNGPEPGAGRADPLRGTKGMLYEGGIRSPLIVWGPGLLREDSCGTTNDTAILCAVDLVPSILSLAAAPSPENQVLDGQDLLATLLGQSELGRTRPILWRRPPDRPGQRDDRWPDLAIRDGPWKLLTQYDGGRPQLYHLPTDVAEAENVADDHPEIVKRLTAQLIAWDRELPADAGPMFPVPAPKAKQRPPGKKIDSLSKTVR